MNTARRPRPAVLDWEHRGFLTWAFLSLYSSHAPFREALVRLFDDYCARDQAFIEFLASRATSLWDAHCQSRGDGALTVPAREYTRAIREIATGWGLTRFGSAAPAREPLREDDDLLRPSEGELLLHEWCQESARRALRGDRPDPMTFWTFHHVGGWRPDVGEVVSVLEYAIHEDTDERMRYIVRDEERRPIVRVSFESEWDPRLEPQQKARARLLADAKIQIDAELDRLAANAEANGYVFNDTTLKRQTHLQWLFEHVALRRSCSDLAGTYLGGWWKRAAVYNAIRPLADEIGLTLGEAA